MTTYQAVIMHGTRGGEGRYEFEGPETLFTETPVRIMRTFMTDLDKRANLGHIDYEINAAFKNKDAETVCVMGNFYFEQGGTQPFLCMISPQTS